MKFAFLIIIGILTPLSVFAECGFHNVTGYIWSRNTGWVSLNCRSGGSVDYGLEIDFETEGDTLDVSGYAWSSNMGWLDFDPSGGYPGYGSALYDAEFFRNTGIGISPTTTAGVLKGWAKWNALGDDGWMIVGPINIGGIDYGVEIGTDRLIDGWSWNGGDNIDADVVPEEGDGWVIWDSSVGGASVLSFWFETLYGSIYSGGNINAQFAPPLNRYNATYLIQANGTIKPVAIRSAGGGGIPYVGDQFPYISESHDSFALPDAQNKYRGTLGWIDKAGMLAGRYGVVESSIPTAAEFVLDGKIYHYTSDLIISSDTTFKDGNPSQNPKQKGNGTIIVDGDLYINADMYYKSESTKGRVENLASVAWVVSGDIIIDKDVTNLVGLFYSEGEIHTGTRGAIINADIPITIEGILIAKKIFLERLFSDDTSEPAEKIIFDGRAIINPPPGMSDIGKGLPVFNETLPQ